MGQGWSSCPDPNPPAGIHARVLPQVRKGGANQLPLPTGGLRRPVGASFSSRVTPNNNSGLVEAILEPRRHKDAQRMPRNCDACLLGRPARNPPCSTNKVQGLPTRSDGLPPPLFWHRVCAHLSNLSRCRNRAETLIVKPVVRPRLYRVAAMMDYDVEPFVCGCHRCGPLFPISVIRPNLER